MLEVLKNHVLRYQEAPDLGAYSEYHMIAASLLQSTGGGPTTGNCGFSFQPRSMFPMFHGKTCSGIHFKIR